MLSLISSRVHLESSLLKVRVKERFQEVLVKRLHADEGGAVLIESVSPFATVGFGRISSMGYFKVAAIFESVLGWLTLALFLVTLANVLLR